MLDGMGDRTAFCRKDPLLVRSPKLNENIILMTLQKALAKV
ncbi:hypothetical protein [Nodularia sphaerocarpa]|nr:hypothetical protein [Nodularia sphaerocarpa]MDB9373553.1 hypothetical protein [Nodularia sphaerocarpa CS-585]MDB9376799.1 hypothetical protein [Nodularia sphaerocarpa CS-585A2]